MEMKEPGSQGKVKELINQKNQFKWGELVEKLASLGPSAVPELLEVVRSDYNNKIYACEALEKIGDPAALEPLFQELKKMGDPRPVVRALSRIVDQAHADMFLELLSEGDNNATRGGAAMVLGALAGKGVDAALKDRIVQALLKAFQEEIKVTRYLIIAPGATKDPRVIDTLVSCMDKDPSVEVIEALGNFNEDRVVDVLISQLRTPESYKEGCIKSLARIGNRRAVAPILDILKSNEHRLDHKAAAKALGKLGDESAVEALINCLSTEGDSRTREEAANSLGLLNDSRAVDALKKAQEDEEDYVRDAATKALDVLGVHEAPPQVIDPPKIQGILVLSHDELDEEEKSNLLFEILIQQRKLGYQIAKGGEKEVVCVAGDSLNDMAYVYASIRLEFSNLGGAELIDRAYKYDFKASNGNYGNYYIIFTRPK